MKNGSVHVLADWEPGFIRSWKEWLELWENTEQVELRHSLLHFGLDVPECDDWPGRLMFYLDVADGHDSELSLRSKIDRVHHFGSYQTSLGSFEGASHVRRQLALKAFQGLCVHLFTNKNATWDTFLAQQNSLDKVMWFLRMNEYGSLLNRPHEPRQREIFDAFVLQFCRYVWKGSGLLEIHGREAGERIKEMFVKSRPRLVLILCGLRKEDALLNTEEFPLDAPALWALRTFVWGKELHLPDHKQGGSSRTIRVPDSLDEAIFGGSQAARVLQILLTVVRERRRHKMMVEATRTLRDAERAIETLKRLV